MSMNERVAVLESQIEDMGNVVDDHEVRLRSTEKRQYIFMGVLTAVQTIVLIVVQFWLNTKK